MTLVNMDGGGAGLLHQHHYDENDRLVWEGTHTLRPNFVPVPFLIGQIYMSGRARGHGRAIEEYRKALNMTRRMATPYYQRWAMPYARSSKR